MSRYTGHASLQELLGRSSGNRGYGGYGESSNGFGNAAARGATDDPLSDPSPASPTGKARARALLPPQVVEALFGHDGAAGGGIGGAGGTRKRPREGGEEQAADPAPGAPPPAATASRGGAEARPCCPVCGRALALFASSSASSSSAPLDLDSVNRHVDACLIASRGKNGGAAAAAEAASGKGGDRRSKGKQRGQRQASLLGMRKVVKVKREEGQQQQQQQTPEEAGEQQQEKSAAAPPPSPAPPGPPPPPRPPPPLLSLPPLSETCFESRLVSRRHAAANASSTSSAAPAAAAAAPAAPAAAARETETPSLAAGAVVSLLRERSNAADGAAVRAVAFPGAAGSLGYLPSSVAARLAPLLDAPGGACAATATLCEGCPSGGGLASPLRVRVEVVLPRGGSGSDEARIPCLLRLVAAAAAAAREDSARGASGPGGRLLAAALPALDAALTPREEGGDAHLFSAEELSVLGALRGRGGGGGGGGGAGVPREAAALFLRIYSSRRPSRWVRPSKVAASSGESSPPPRAEGGASAAAAASAALALVRAGLAVPLPAGGDGDRGDRGEDALVAASDALTSGELRAALLSFSRGSSAPSFPSSSSSSTSSPAYASPLSASALRRMGRADLLSLAARALRGRSGGAPAAARAGMTAALCAALAAAPSPASAPAAPPSLSAPRSSPLPAFRLRTAAMRALRRCERAAFLSEGVTFSTVSAAAAGGMRSLPRYRADRWRAPGPALPPAFASRAEFLEYETSLAEAAALDDALDRSLSASTPAERAEAAAAVEAAMVPCVDFVTRRRQMMGGDGDGGGGGGFPTSPPPPGGAGGGGAGTKKENAPPPPTATAAATATAASTWQTQQNCSSPQPPAAAPAPSSASFLTRFSALGVRLACATVSAAWLEGRRRRAEADEIHWGCLGVTAPPSPSPSSGPSSAAAAAAVGQQQSPPQERRCSFRRRGHWWTRLALNAEAAGRPSQALEVVEAALADDADNVSWGDRLGLMRRGHRLARPPRRWKAPPAAWAAAAGREPRERVLVAATLDSSTTSNSRSASKNAKSVFEGNLTVERLALDFYSKPQNGGWKGAHAEGGVWGCLFRALFHDVMFPPSSPSSETEIGGGSSGGSSDGCSSSELRALSMLRVPCQRYPLDFGSPLFYELRKDQIDALLERIRASSPADLAGTVSRIWDRGLGPYAAGGTEGRWNTSDGRGPRGGAGRQELRELCGCLGGRALAAVLELFAKGVAREGGMPDLVLWRLKVQEGSVDLFGEAMVVEVKGPRDRLSVRFFF